MQLNSLKRYLRLQSLPSIQEAYALPDSPHHVATITGSMQKMQLSGPPTRLASRWPQPQLQPTQASTAFQTDHSFAAQAAAAAPGRTQSADKAPVSFAACVLGKRGDQQAVAPMGGSARSAWDDSGIQRRHKSVVTSCGDVSGGQEEVERYWREQERMRLEAHQQEAFKTHLAW